MSTILYAQPYDISAEGFYFRSSEEYDKQAATLKNSYGDIVEEFEIQFIDGEDIDCELAKAVDINQANFRGFLERIDEWLDWEKQRIIVAVGECGNCFVPDRDPASYKVDIYEAENMRALAEQFVDEGLYGEIPEKLQFYIDYDAIARDLAVEFFETTVAGVRLVCASY